MYVAVDEKGEVRNSLDEEITKSDFYFCPHCREKVIFKKGIKIQSHFAHQKNSECSYQSYKKESAEHLSVKRNLYKHFRNKYDDVKIEYIFKTGDSMQIADVYLVEKNVAFEYQRSIIPFSELLKRTCGYKKANIKLIWLIDTNKFVKELKQRNDIFYIRYAPFVDNFLNYHRGCIFFYGYDMEENSIIFYQLWSVSLKTRNALCKKQMIKLEDFSVPVDIKFSKENNVAVFTKSDIENYVYVQLKYDKTVKNKLLSMLYNEKIALNNIPKQIGINYNEQLLLATPLLIWQTEFYKIFNMGKSFSEINRWMLNFIKFKDFLFISEKEKQEILKRLIKRHYELLL